MNSFSLRIKPNDIECFERTFLGDSGISIESKEIFSYHTHTHSYYEMTLYEPFDGSININGNDYMISTPSIILIPPSSFHKITSSTNSEARYIKVAFSEDILTLYSAQIPNWPVMLAPIASDSFIISLFHEMLWKKDSPAYIAMLINTAVYLTAENGEKLSPANISRENSLAMKAVRIINEYYCTDLTLHQTAGMLSVTPQYLSHIFSKNVGISFAKYLCEMRLNHAAELILESNSCITEICYACGYRNLSHFLRSFKERYGVTPKMYRKLHTNL